MDTLTRRALIHRSAALLVTGPVAAMLVGLSGAPRAEEGRSGGERIVSVGGSVTEVVYALGAGDRLVAVDSTSQYPPEARELPDVGYLRQLAAEPILGLSPSLVLAAEDAGPASALDQLREAGTRVVTVPDEPSPEGVIRKLDAVAGALGLEERGRALAERLEAEFARLDVRLSALQDRPRVLFLLSIGQGGAPLAAGEKTSAAGIIELAGGRNAVEGFVDFKPISPEAGVLAAPDVILVTERTLDFLGGYEALAARPEVAATPAGRTGRFVAMDGLLLLGFGPRSPQAVRLLAEALHPGLSLAPVSD